jgi:hypothetical protein
MRQTDELNVGDCISVYELDKTRTRIGTVIHKNDNSITIEFDDGSHVTVGGFSLMFCQKIKSRSHGLA